jgi:hypothetical protein
MVAMAQLTLVEVEAVLTTQEVVIEPVMVAPV